MEARHHEIRWNLTKYDASTTTHPAIAAFVKVLELTLLAMVW